MTDLVKRLRIKAGMIEMGEMIAWGSDSALMREAADALELATPAVQGEPVGEVRFELGAPSFIFAELYSKSLPVLAPGTKLYAAPPPAVHGEPVATVTEEVFGSDGTSDFISARLPVGTKLYAAPQQPDTFRGDNAALIRSAQSLLSLDDKGAFGPNGIGGHARNIITAFIARISAEQQSAPDVDVLVEALSALRGCIMETRGPDAHSALVLADVALAAYRKGDNA